MRLGVDLGGTKIEVIALGPTDAPVFKKRVPTPRGSYAGIVQAVVDLIQQTDVVLGGKGSVGIGIPGTHVPSTGRIKNANTTELNGQPLWADIEQALGRPVRISNDANCFALSEAQGGAGRGYGVVFGVILGTGCGGGVVVRGQVVAGANGIAGEWGHIRLPDLKDTDLPLPACYCGQHGCLETYVSGTGFTADFSRVSGRTLSAVEIARAADAGDAAATSACERLEDRLARGLAVVMNVLDPDCIILGGGLSQMQRLYREVPKLWRHYVFSKDIETRLLPAQHGDASGGRGAARLWDERPAGL